MFTFLENLVLFLVNEWAPVRQIILTENWKAPCFFSYHSSVLGKTENGFHSGLVWRRAVEKPGSRLKNQGQHQVTSQISESSLKQRSSKLLYVYMTGSKPVRRRPTLEHLHFLNGQFSGVGTKKLVKCQSMVSPDVHSPVSACVARPMTERRREGDAKRFDQWEETIIPSVFAEGHIDRARVRVGVSAWACSHGELSEQVSLDVFQS